MHLVENGISSFSINTRMAFMGQIFGGGIFDDSIMDIEASVDRLAPGGFPENSYTGLESGRQPERILRREQPSPEPSGVSYSRAAHIRFPFPIKRDSRSGTAFPPMNISMR